MNDNNLTTVDTREEAECTDTRKPLLFEKVIFIKDWDTSKDQTIVFWSDGTKTKVVRSQDDFFNHVLAIASAHMIKRFGNNSQYKKYIRDTIGDLGDGIYGNYNIVAIYETTKIYGGWENFIQRIDERAEYPKLILRADQITEYPTWTPKEKEDA